MIGESTMRNSIEQQRSRWLMAARLALPIDNGARDIRALDGLRAIAALSIVAFHFYLAERLEFTSWGKEYANYFYFLASGVHLFFVLSGFLLFLPYARAILHSKALPSAKNFYKRRGLRVLPAYLVSLFLLIFLEPNPQGITGWLWVEDVITHIFLIHDDFSPFAQTIEGPFWTLAVEVQFYLALPLLALILARVVGTSRSIVRLVGGISGIIIFALALRTVDSVVMANLPKFSGALGSFGQIFVHVTMGELGKFLEVFAVGMLCAVLYVATVEDKKLSVTQQQRVAWLIFAGAIILLLLLPPFQVYTSTRYAPGAQMGVLGIVVPGLIGLGYGLLLLAIVWGHKIIHTPFEFYPLRFIGLISFSLYLWHLPIIQPLIPALNNPYLNTLRRLPLAFLVAYLSYQLVERPFLSRHRKGERPSSQATPATAITGEPSLAVPD
jgi:peptidoglycan/LPS O-acetylase OafA/YrhL